MTARSMLLVGERALACLLGGMVVALFGAALVWLKFLAPWPFMGPSPEFDVRALFFFGAVFGFAACVARIGRWLARRIPEPGAHAHRSPEDAFRWPWPEPEAVKEMHDPAAVVMPSPHQLSPTDRDPAE